MVASRGRRVLLPAEITSSRKSAPSPRDKQYLHVWIILGVERKHGQLGVHPGIDSIQFLGTVEGRERNATRTLLDENCLIAVLRKHNSTSFCRLPALRYAQLCRGTSSGLGPDSAYSQA